MARRTVQTTPGVLHTLGPHTGMYTKKTVCMCARIRHSPMEDVSISGCHAPAHADVSLRNGAVVHYRGRSPPSLSRDQPKPAPPPSPPADVGGSGAAA